MFPGQYGTPQPFYFFLLPSYWRPEHYRRRRYADSSANAKDDAKNNNLDPSVCEPAPSNMKAGISIKNLRKSFKAETGGVKVAVDGLSLDMYEDQITALLGHNGAGKTTTISMLVGLYPPTSGTAVVNDCDIVDDIRGVRRSLGMCPQFGKLRQELN